MSEESTRAIAADRNVDSIPILIAVTGHRTFPETIRPQLEQAFADLLGKLREQYAHTPLRLLSGLAEGADRLAARVARTHGVELMAVLPKPVAEYEHDFASPESVAEFREFLPAAAEIIVTGGQNFRDADARDSLYARQGAWLVRHCDVLVAFWDGEPAQGDGGTGNIVRFRTEGVPKPYSEARNLFEKRVGAVYQIVTPRNASSAGSAAAGQVRLLMTDGASRGTFTISELNPMIAAVDAFNRDLRTPTLSAADSSLAIPDDACLADLAAEARQSLTDLRRRFAAADQLAIHFQARTWLLFRAMLACSVASLVCLQLHTADNHSSGPFLALYLALLLAAYALYGVAKRNRYESRAFDYRAIAEGLRVQYFWRIAGFEASVADYYLGRQQGVLDWIRRTLMIWTERRLPQRTGRPVAAASLRFLQTHWVEDQLRFFRSTSDKQRRLQRRLDRVANALVLLGILLAAFKLLFQTAAWWTPLAAAPPVIAAALLAYGNTRALSEQVNQYDSMREMFAVAEEQLRHCVATGDVAAGQQLILELGKEALAENADWLQLHRRRPVSQPKVGL